MQVIAMQVIELLMNPTISAFVKYEALYNLLPRLGTLMWDYDLGPPFGTPDLGPPFGTPIWYPHLGPPFGTPIWDPHLGPPIWDPHLGPPFGTPIWDPHLGPPPPDFRPQF
jgi:hypothetical protein